MVPLQSPAVGLVPRRSFFHAPVQSYVRHAHSRSVLMLAARFTPFAAPEQPLLTRGCPLRLITTNGSVGLRPLLCVGCVPDVALLVQPFRQLLRHRPSSLHRLLAAHDFACASGGPRHLRRLRTVPQNLGKTTHPRSPGTTVSCDGDKCLLLAARLMVDSGVTCAKPLPPKECSRWGRYLGFSKNVWTDDTFPQNISPIVACVFV